MSGLKVFFGYCQKFTHEYTMCEWEKMGEWGATLIFALLLQIVDLPAVG